MKYPRLARTAFVLCLFSSFLPISSKRMIFMPFPIPSHTLMHVNLARAMIGKGHEVWLVLSDTVLTKGVTNITGLSVIEFHTTYSVEADVVNDLFLKCFLAGESIPAGIMNERFESISHEILSNDSLYQQMKSVKADLFVYDDGPRVAKMFVIFPYRLGIPFACFDFTFQPFYRRVPFSPAAVPAFLSRFDQRMSLVERLKNTWMFLIQFLYCPFVHVHKDGVARYAPEMPYLPFDQLASRAEVWLIQSDPILQFPYPTVPNVKYIGGIAASPPAPLNSEFQSFMDSGKDGVIVATFGSMLVNMPKAITAKLMTVFLKLRPLKVVFRLNVTSPDSDQILTTTWLPQNSLLAHPNCRVFVTHCGLSGQYQALYHGVPMLGLPLVFDEYYNAYIMQLKGYGIVMDIRKVSAEEMVEAIRRLVEEPGYKDTISKASRLFRELYGVPVTSAAYWLDHVMQYGGDYMRSSGQEMALYQWLMLDVLGILAGCVTVSVLVICCCLRCLAARFRKAKTKTE